MAPEQNETATDYVTVEIYDQIYHLSGQDVEHIRQLAARVDAKMRAVAAQGRTVDSLRVAVLAALNIADEYLVLKRKYDSIANDYHARTEHLSGALDAALEEARRAG